MKMVKWLMVLALLAAMPAYAESPFKVRGIALGDTQGQIQAMYPDVSDRYGQRKGAYCLADVWCTLDGYGDVHDASVFYTLIDGRVESVRVRVDADRFGGLMLAIRIKHGAPQSETDEPVQNRMGATFSNRVLTWFDAGSGQTLRAEERRGTVSDSAITLTSAEGDAARLARFRQGKAAEADKL